MVSPRSLRAPGLLRVRVVVDDVVDRFHVGHGIGKRAAFGLMGVEAVMDGNESRGGVQRSVIVPLAVVLEEVRVCFGFPRSVNAAPLDGYFFAISTVSIVSSQAPSKGAVVHDDVLRVDDEQAIGIVLRANARAAESRGSAG